MKTKEFISIEGRARFLADTMAKPQPSSEEALRPMDDLSVSHLSREPIKPEDIPGAVKVFPGPISSTTTGSGNLHWKLKEISPKYCTIYDAKKLKNI